MDLSVFERLAERFSECHAEIKRGKRARQPVEALISEASKVLFDAISSKAVNLQDAPESFFYVPKKKVEGGGKRMAWEIYWLNAVYWICVNRREIFPDWPGNNAAHFLWTVKFHPDRLIGDSLVKIETRADKVIWLDLASLCADVCSYLAHIVASKPKPAETEQKDQGSKIMITATTSKENWEGIRSEYDISKKDFGKKINFVSDSFKRKIIFRDVEHAFVLASQGFPKPSLILAGGVIEELLRLYLEHKNIPVTSENFVDYIKTCEQKGLLKSGISKLSDSVREFRNLVHLSREETNRYTISKAAAKGAVSSIFTIANDFQ